MDNFAFNSETSLEFDRVIAASPATVWRCHTEPGPIEQWFCPKPWEAHDVVIPRPGGAVHTPMRGLKGEEMDGGPGCILVAKPEPVLTFTDAMGPGSHPRASGFMTGVYLLAQAEASTQLTARALHADAANRDSHAEMGSFEGWGTAVDQLAALATTL